MSLPARYPKADWRGPVDNKTPGGLVEPLYGLVQHTEEGSESGTDTWFHEDRSQVSAHLGFAKDGTVQQWVEFGDKAWAEVAGNSRWLSAEAEGDHTEPLTREQLVAEAEFYAWAHDHEPDSFPLRTSESVTEPGFGWHGMGGLAWGGHYDCPGHHREEQRTTVIAKAITILHAEPAKTPHEPKHPMTPPFPGILEAGLHAGALHDVEVLRDQLRARGWNVAAHGDFDEKLERAVLDFQAEKGLRVDGIVGPATWWALWHLPVT